MWPAMTGLEETLKSLDANRDFNAILEDKDRIMGNPIQESEVKGFANFLEDNRLTKMKQLAKNTLGPMVMYSVKLIEL